MKNTLKKIANILLWIITMPFIALFWPLAFMSWLLVTMLEGIRSRLIQVPLLKEIFSDY